MPRSTGRADPGAVAAQSAAARRVFKAARERLRHQRRGLQVRSTSSIVPAAWKGSGRSPAASKQELIASLDSLQDTHQFQIVFYNEEPTAFNPSGEQGRLAFATEQNKERARRFVGSVSAYGSTNHVRALEVAIKMQPDVIFFLTDADEPRLGGSFTSPPPRRRHPDQRHRVRHWTESRWRQLPCQARPRERRRACLPRYHEIRPAMTGAGESLNTVRPRSTARQPRRVSDGCGRATRRARGCNC